mgnify:CR=1 FL=1
MYTQSLIAYVVFLDRSHDLLQPPLHRARDAFHVCARAVALVNASCAALLVSPAFPVGIGFQPLLDAANAACAHTAAAGMADEGTVRREQLRAAPAATHAQAAPR